MALETSLIGRVLGMFFGLFRVMSRRRNAGKWVGQWVAHDLVGRNLAQPMRAPGLRKSLFLAGGHSPRSLRSNATKPTHMGNRPVTR